MGSQVAQVPFIFVADVFENIGVGLEMDVVADSKWPGVIDRIVESDRDFHVAEVAAAESLGHMHRFAARMAEGVEPGLVVEPRGLDYQSACFPLSGGVAEPGRFRVGWKR